MKDKTIVFALGICGIAGLFCSGVIGVTSPTEEYTMLFNVVQAITLFAVFIYIALVNIGIDKEEKR